MLKIASRNIRFSLCLVCIRLLKSTFPTDATLNTRLSRILLLTSSFSSVDDLLASICKITSFAFSLTALLSALSNVFTLSKIPLRSSFSITSILEDVNKCGLLRSLNAHHQHYQTWSRHSSYRSDNLTSASTRFFIDHVRYSEFRALLQQNCRTISIFIAVVSLVFVSSSCTHGQNAWPKISTDWSGARKKRN